MGFGGAFSLLGLDSRRLVTGGAEGGLIVATFSIVVLPTVSTQRPRKVESKRIR